MKNLNDYDICQKALENEIFLNGFKKSKNWKLILYVLFLMIFNSYTLPGKKIYIINGKSEKRFTIPESFDGVYYGIVDKNIFIYRHLTTYMSNVKRLERIKIFINSCRQYCYIKQYNIPLGYYLDFQYWKNFICHNNFKIILSNGHYDRLTTQLAYICRENNCKFIIKQHGIISKMLKIPYKIPADIVYAFNNNEIEKFKENIICGSCEYKIFFQLSVNFVCTEKRNMRVGIIEQPLKDMENIIDLVLKIYKRAEIFVMIHPLSKNNYSKYSKNRNVVFLKGDKEWNLDCIVTKTSTLALEYVLAGYKNAIFVIDENNDFTELAEEYSNVIICETLGTLECALNKISNYSMDGKL